MKASNLTGTIVLLLADASCAAFICSLMIDSHVLPLWLNTCDTFFVAFFLLMIVLQSLLYLRRLSQRLDQLINAENTAELLLLPYPRLHFTVMNGGMSLAASLILNLALFLAVLRVSGFNDLHRQAEDLEELCWHSDQPVTSSAVDVTLTQSFVNVVPMITLTFIVYLRKRRARPANAAGNISDVETTTTSEESTYGFFNMAKSDCSMWSGFAWCGVLVDVGFVGDVFCSAVLVFFRLAFAVCSCASFDVYATLMKLLLVFTVLKMCVGLVLSCSSFYFIPRAQSKG